MPNPMTRIHDIETNEIVDREMTDQEFKQYKVDQESFKADKAEIESKKAARESALSKLAALGLTPEEINAIS